MTEFFCQGCGIEIFRAGLCQKCVKKISALMPAMKDALDELVSLFEESHADEVLNNHFGDGPKGCSYCRGIEKAKTVIEKFENLKA